MQNLPMPRTAKKPAVRAAPPKAGRRSAQPSPGLAESGEPLWRQVVQSLRTDILKGVFRVGAQLPTEGELSERFAVSRHTVREALRQLRTDGLVSSRRGSGTTVMPAQPSTPFNVHRVASIDELIAYASESRYVIERTDVVSADATAGSLGLPEAGRWLRLDGIRLPGDGGEVPICWTTVFVAEDFMGVERLLNSQRGPIWRLIEDIYGERLVEVDQMLRVQALSPELAAKLQVEAGSSAVEVRRTYRNTRGQVAEVSVNLYPADKFQFNMKLSRA
ncbi:MAG: GntR family transcriptional regulator [Pseudorhodoferax sp.]